MEHYPCRIMCPYDQTHEIEPLRMPYHLIRCRKNHPYMEMAVCPFNALHEVHKAELRYHMEHCPDKTLLEKEIWHDALKKGALNISQPRLKGYTELPKYNYKKDEEIVDDEWDREPTHTRFSLFSSNSEIRRSRNQETEPVSLRYPVTASKAAQLCGPSGQLKQLRSQELMASATSDPSTDVTSSKTYQTVDSRSAQTGVGRGRSFLVPEESKLSTESDSSTQKSSSSSTFVEPSGTLPEVGRGRGSLMSAVIGRGRARPTADSSTPNKPGVSNSSSLLSKLLSLKQGVGGDPCSITAIARGRSRRSEL